MRSNCCWTSLSLWAREEAGVDNLDTTKNYFSIEKSRLAAALHRQNSGNQFREAIFFFVFLSME